MQFLPRFVMLLSLAMWSGNAWAATTTSKSKSKGKGATSSSSSSKPKSAAKTDPEEKSKPTTDKPKTETAVEKPKPETSDKVADTPAIVRPAAVSTISIENLSGFDKYPKQVQSLVLSCLALTHLELRYTYGSHEPSNGGMDCSGTMYHVLHFQGLKDVPRQSDEMAMWVEKKAQLHLTSTATSFDSPEFNNLKPGDMLFWTNTTATTRKLPVTHVMIYLGKLKDSGKRVIFGASDGRSFAGQRRSGVSVFDFSLPRAEGTARLYGYGPPPGLLPQEVTVAASPPAPPVPKEDPAKKEAPKEPEAVAKTTPAEVVSAPKEEPSKEAVEPAKTAATPVKQQDPASPKPAEIQEEVRKAVAINGDVPQQEETRSTATDKESVTKPVTAKTDEPVKKAPSPSKPKASTTKAKTGTSSKNRVSSSTSTRRRAPAPPPKNSVERAMDNAVDSVKRLFR